MLHSKNVMECYYWIEWIIQFMHAHKCVAVERQYSTKYKNDGIWLVWDTILAYIEPGLLKQIGEAVVHLFSIAYSPASKDRRRFLLYYAASLCCEKIDTDIDMVSDKKIIESAYNKCWIMFKNIKSHEIK
jgi:hypothetical protein